MFYFLFLFILLVLLYTLYAVCLFFCMSPFSVIKKKTAPLHPFACVIMLHPPLLCADSLQTRPLNSVIWMCVWVCESFQHKGRTLRCQRIRTQDSHGPARSSFARVFHLRISLVYRPMAHAPRVHHLRVSKCGIIDLKETMKRDAQNASVIFNDADRELAV